MTINMVNSLFFTLSDVAEEKECVLTSIISLCFVAMQPRLYTSLIYK